MRTSGTYVVGERDECDFLMDQVWAPWWRYERLASRSGLCLIIVHKYNCGGITKHWITGLRDDRRLNHLHLLPGETHIGGKTTCSGHRGHPTVEFRSATVGLLSSHISSGSYRESRGFFVWPKFHNQHGSPRSSSAEFGLRKAGTIS